jgi:hypothetical protein
MTGNNFLPLKQNVCPDALLLSVCQQRLQTRVRKMSELIETVGNKIFLVSVNGQFCAPRETS